MEIVVIAWEMMKSIIDSGIDYRHKDLKVTNNDVKLTQSNMNTAIEQLDYGKYFTNKIPYGYNYVFYYLSGDEENKSKNVDKYTLDSYNKINI